MQKVRKHFCLALPLTHTNTLVDLMQTTDMVTLDKFVTTGWQVCDMLSVPKDNLPFMIYLSSNELSGPKWM